MKQLTTKYLKISGNALLVYIYTHLLNIVQGSWFCSCGLFSKRIPAANKLFLKKLIPQLWYDLAKWIYTVSWFYLVT